MTVDVTAIPNTGSRRRSHSIVPDRGDDFVLGGCSLTYNGTRLAVSGGTLTIADGDTVYAVEIDGTQFEPSSDGTVYVDVDPAGPSGDVALQSSAPAAPSLAIGTVDTSAGTTAETNRTPTYESFSADAAVTERSQVHSPESVFPRSPRGPEGFETWNLVPHPSFNNPVLTDEDLSAASFPGTNILGPADPFWFWDPEARELWLVYEVQSDAYTIAASRIATGSSQTAETPVDISTTVEVIPESQGDHAYPFPFYVDGTYAISPTSRGGGDVAIFTSDAFPNPGGWTREYTVDTFSNGGDGTFFKYYGSDSSDTFDTWYCMCGTDNGVGLYYTDEATPLTNNWTEHPDSPGLEADADVSTLAGRVIPTETCLYQPRRAGWDMRMVVIEELTTTTYNERIYRRNQSTSSQLVAPATDGTAWDEYGHHHMDLLAPTVNGDPMVAVDGRNDSQSQDSLGIFTLQSGGHGSVSHADARSRSSNQTITGGGPSAVDFPAKRIDVSPIGWVPGNKELQFGQEGVYQITAHVVVDNFASTPNYVQIEVNPTVSGLQTFLATESSPGTGKTTLEVSNAIAHISRDRIEAGAAYRPFAGSDVEFDVVRDQSYLSATRVR
jgi:hypothetical protein